MGESDQLLVHRWRRGDRDAGTELFRRYFDAVRRFFRTKVHPDDVEDLVQTTFATLVEGRDRFRGDGLFAAFLYGVARRKLYEHLRRRRRDQRGALDLTAESVRSLGITPSSAIAAKQEHAWVQTALQRIPVQFQVMIELSYWEEIPGPELARILDISPTTVRTRLFRAREALEAELRTLAGVGPDEALPFDPGVLIRGARESV